MSVPFLHIRQAFTVPATQSNNTARASQPDWSQKTGRSTQSHSFKDNRVRGSKKKKRKRKNTAFVLYLRIQIQGYLFLSSTKWVPQKLCLQTTAVTRLKNLFSCIFFFLSFFEGKQSAPLAAFLVRIPYISEKPYHTCQLPWTTVIRHKRDERDRVQGGKKKTSIIQRQCCV